MFDTGTPEAKACKLIASKASPALGPNGVSNQTVLNNFRFPIQSKYKLTRYLSAVHSRLYNVEYESKLSSDVNHDSHDRSDFSTYSCSASLLRQNAVYVSLTSIIWTPAQTTFVAATKGTMLHGRTLVM